MTEATTNLTRAEPPPSLPLLRRRRGKGKRRSEAVSNDGLSDQANRCSSLPDCYPDPYAQTALPPPLQSRGGLGWGAFSLWVTVQPPPSLPLLRRVKAKANAARRPIRCARRRRRNARCRLRPGNRRIAPRSVPARACRDYAGDACCPAGYRCSGSLRAEIRCRRR